MKEAVRYISPFAIQHPEKVIRGTEGHIAFKSEQGFFVLFNGARAPIRVQPEEIEIINSGDRKIS